MPPSSLPAAPLVAAIDRVLKRTLGEIDTSTHAGRRAATDLRNSALARMQLDPRALYAWRTGERPTVTFNAADRVLSGTPYLWLDVWPECQYHAAPALGCIYCDTHYRAQELFTGAPLPPGFERRR